jgi:ACS family hexuronate transporter-like MFS transporter
MVPARERGFAGGLFNIGASVGSMLAPPLVAWAILSYDWQTAFVITGGIGIVWVVLWLVFFDTPDRHRALSPEERQMIVEGQERHLAGGARPSPARSCASATSGASPAALPGRSHVGHADRSGCRST